MRARAPTALSRWPSAPTQAPAARSRAEPRPPPRDIGGTGKAAALKSGDVAGRKGQRGEAKLRFAARLQWCRRAPSSAREEWEGAQNGDRVQRQQPQYSRMVFQMIHAWISWHAWATFFIQHYHYPSSVWCICQPLLSHIRGCRSIAVSPFPCIHRKLCRDQYTKQFHA